MSKFSFSDNFPDCDNLYYLEISEEYCCSYQMTKKDKEKRVCCFDSTDIESLKKDGFSCPCWPE